MLPIPATAVVIEPLFPIPADALMILALWFTMVRIDCVGNSKLESDGDGPTFDDDRYVQNMYAITLMTMKFASNRN